MKGVQDYTSAATGQYYYQYIQFRPCNNITNTANPEITMTNLGQSTAFYLDTLPETEWTKIYAKTRLQKVVVKYIPAITEGIAGTSATNLSMCNSMYTIPIYDNVDAILDSAGEYVPDTARETLNDLLVKPYSKCHSMFKPWTRIIKPTSFLKAPGYESGDHFYKKNFFIDLANTDEAMNGLLVLAEPVQTAGLLTGIGQPPKFPTQGNSFVLGRIQFTCYQSFKTRT